MTTLQNPADIASRGMTAAELQNNSMWFSGPSFLYESSIEGYLSNETHLSQEDPEVKPVCLKTKTVENFDLKVFEACSSWKRAVNVAMLCLLFMLLYLNCDTLYTNVKMSVDLSGLRQKNVKNREVEKRCST